MRFKAGMRPALLTMAVVIVLTPAIAQRAAAQGEVILPELYNAR